MTSNKVVLKIEGYLRPKTYIENGKKRAAIEIVTDGIDFEGKTNKAHKGHFKTILISGDKLH